MTIAQDYVRLALLLNAENVREEVASGRNLEDMRLQLRVLRRQLRNMRGYRPPVSIGTGGSGPTGPATGG